MTISDCIEAAETAYEKRCRGLHRIWSWAASEWDGWGTEFWPLGQMHHRATPAPSATASKEIK